MLANLYIANIYVKRAAKGRTGMILTTQIRALAGLLAVFLIVWGSEVWAAEVTVHAAPVDDLKSVIATVEPNSRAGFARPHRRHGFSPEGQGRRSRRGGRRSRAHHRSEVVSSDSRRRISRIQSLQAQRDKAKADFDRAQDLFQHGVTTKVLLDQARTAFDVAEKSLAALRSDRGVVEQQTSEGKVLAPGAGRVLTVPVSVGRAVMPGETIATVTDDKYILRLQLPERHARFIRAGDTVQIGGRGVEESPQETRTTGHVRLVYPQIQGGRVLADVEVDGLGDYFVGERTARLCSDRQAQSHFVPRGAVYRRAGVDFVHLHDGAEVVVQTGETRGKDIEILSGLRDGDVVVVP